MSARCIRDRIRICFFWGSALHPAKKNRRTASLSFPASQTGIMLTPESHLLHVKDLVNAGRIATAKHDTVASMLRLACLYGHAEAVEALLAATAFDVNHRFSDRGNNTLLSLAVRMRHTEVVRALVNTGRCDTNLTYRDEDNYIVTVLMMCTFDHYGEEVIDILRILLSDPSCDVNVIDGNYALLHACLNGYAESAKMILDTGRVSCATLHGVPAQSRAQAPSHAAKDAKIMQLLIDVGCDLNVPNSWEETALMHHCFEGKLDVVKMMAAAGARMHPTHPNDSFFVQREIRDGLGSPVWSEQEEASMIACFAT